MSKMMEKILELNLAIQSADKGSVFRLLDEITDNTCADNNGTTKIHSVTHLPNETADTNDADRTGNTPLPNSGADQNGNTPLHVAVNMLVQEILRLEKERKEDKSSDVIDGASHDVPERTSRDVPERISHGVAGGKSHDVKEGQSSDVVERQSGGAGDGRSRDVGEGTSRDVVERTSHDESKASDKSLTNDESLDDNDAINLQRDRIDIILKLCATIPEYNVKNHHTRFPVHAILADLKTHLEHPAILELLDALLTKEMIESWTTTDEQQRHGWLNLLHVALLREQWELARLALRKGVDITLMTKRHETALMLACYSVAPPLDIFRELANGDIVNSRSRGYLCPLHIAAEHGNKEVLQILIDEGADLTLRRRGLGRLPVELYCCSCIEDLDMEMFSMLLPFRGCSNKSANTQRPDPFCMVEVLLNRIPRDYAVVSDIMMILLMNMPKIKLNKITFHQCAPGGMTGIYADNHKEMFEMEMIFRNYSSSDHYLCLSNSSCLHLREVYILSVAFVHAGIDISEPVGKLKRESDFDDTARHQCDAIDNLWMEYNAKQANVPSLSECCLQTIRCVLFPMTKEKVAKLGLPQSLFDQVVKRGAANGIMAMVKDMHESEEFKRGYPYVPDFTPEMHSYHNILWE